MYQKYQTDAIVLAARETGEADRTFALYTRDFGLLWARASGVRKEVSKMRHALQLYSCASVGLVRGHHGWRVAGASTSKNNIFESIDSAATFARIARIVLRLIAGEEQNEYLFNVLMNCRSQTSANTGVVELVAVARVLYALGYLSSEAFSSVLFVDTLFNDTHIAEAERIREGLVSSVNRALSETHL